MNDNYYTPVINDLLSDDEIKLIAYTYKTGYDTTPALLRDSFVGYNRADHFRYFVETVCAIEIRNADVTVDYISGQPYMDANNRPQADLMREDVRNNKHLFISTDFNDSPLLGEHYNLLFRTAHDLHHSKTQNCNFSLAGELCAYSKFAAYAMDNEFWIKEILFSEIVAQTCYLRIHGQFPKQKTVTGFKPELINRILNAYGVNS